MGLFSQKRSANTGSCPCGDPTARNDITHWQTHIVEVTLAGGRRALTYECPLCGLGNEFWNTEEDGQAGAPAGFGVHLMTAHRIGI